MRQSHLDARGNILKTSSLLLAIAGGALLSGWRAFGEEPDHEPDAPPRAVRSAPRYHRPVRSSKPDVTAPADPGADSAGEPAAEGAWRSAVDPLVEMRKELRRLQFEVDRLTRQSATDADDRRYVSPRESGSVFPTRENAEGLDDGDIESGLFGSGGYQIDDDEPPDEEPFGEIRLIQAQGDEPPSDFGAMPAQTIRPRRADVLGSVGFPETRPYRPDMAHLRREVEADFKDGITVRTKDDYFSLTFHNLTQVDGRVFNPTGDPLHDTFNIPRQRWYVLGNISPYVRYYTVINRGFGSLDLLDAWADIAVGDIDRDMLQIRVGRMKTPYTYEYIKVSENDLIAPERSVFVSNFAPNREIGIMAHGQLLDKRFEYALGVFNGPRRSFQDFNSGKDLFTFINTKPFLKEDIDWLKQLNLGASWNWGQQHQPLQPSVLTTANDQSSSALATDASPAFLSFAKGVFENGERMQWSGDITYYYKSLGIMAGYQGGFQDYSIQTGTAPGTSADPNATAAFVGVVGTKPVRVPMTGYSVAIFNFLTGEEITRRVELLEPRKEFDPKKFREGNIGAVESFNRLAYIDLGANVFTGGLADPAVNTARAIVLDNGFNWYWNHYLKLTFDWQYCDWATPVFLAPGKTTSFTNLFWFRTQVFF